MTSALRRGPWGPSTRRVYLCHSFDVTPLDVTTEQHPGQTRVVLIGELDIASTQALENELSAVEADSPGTVVLDLRRVEFIDSTGLRALVAADERARSAGRRLAVVRGPDAVERLLTVTQLDQRLDIVDDPDSVGA
jgi:anti-anti-sigma factor